MSGPIAIETPEALAAALADAASAGAPVRLAGSGQWTPWLPPAPACTRLLSTAGMDRITRVDADDLTCSVEPGVTLEALGLALAERGLRLPCARGRDPRGTVAGLFAADPLGALTPGGPEPRNLLLGMTGMLVDGTRFKTGAKVVKSVAGFDLHKLFVGSEGRLFAATELHLKLRALPRAVVGFASEELEAGAAIARFVALRRLPLAPAGCVLELDGQGARLRGWFEGSARAVEVARRAAELEEAAAPGLAELLPPPHTDTLRTVIALRGFDRIWLEGQCATRGIQATVTGGSRLLASGPAAALRELRVALDARSPGRGGRMGDAPVLQSGGPQSEGLQSEGSHAEGPAAALAGRLTDALDPGGVLR